jgi:hypothetical protein
MRLYRSAPVRFLNKQIDWDSDALVWTLHTSTYAPNFDTHAFVSDLTNELATGGGYTAGTTSGGGLAIASPTMTYTAANSWTPTRANATAYAVGDVVKPSGGNGFLYMCAVAGTSHSAAPTFPTVVGTTVAEGSGTVVWECVGSGITVFGCTNPTWASPFTAGPFRYAVLSDRTSGANATNPLIGLIDFGSDKTGGGGSFVATLHPDLRAMHVFAP